MHRTEGDSYGIVSGKRVYREESPGNWDATQAQAVDGNAWQEELANIIEDGGISLNTPSETVAQMNQASGVVQGYVAAEAFTRNANDRVTNGDMVRDQINTVNDTDFDEPLFATVMRLMGRTLTGFWCAQISTPSDRVAINRGYAVAVSDAQIINLKTTLRKDLESTWVVGDNQGGRASSVALVDDTWYHLFVIKKADGTVDAGYDTAVNAANLLTDTGYTYYRRVASLYYIDSTSKVRAFYHDLNSDYFLNAEYVSHGSFAVAASPAVTTRTLLKCVPPGLVVRGDFWVSGTHGTQISQLQFWDGALGATAPTFAFKLLSPIGEIIAAQIPLISDNAQKVYCQETNATTASTGTIYCRGYHDSRWTA